MAGNLVKLRGKSAPFSLVTRNQSILDDGATGSGVQSFISNYHRDISLVSPESTVSSSSSRVFAGRGKVEGKKKQSTRDRELARLREFRGDSYKSRIHRSVRVTLLARCNLFYYDFFVYMRIDTWCSAETVDRAIRLQELFLLAFFCQFCQ